jgi:hypothetical protein
VHMTWADYARLAQPFRAEGCLHEQAVGAHG